MLINLCALAEKNLFFLHVMHYCCYDCHYTGKTCNKFNLDNNTRKLTTHLYHHDNSIEKKGLVPLTAAVLKNLSEQASET